MYKKIKKNLLLAVKTDKMAHSSHSGCKIAKFAKLIFWGVVLTDLCEKGFIGI